MLDRCYRKVQWLLFGCLACLALTSVVNADGRVFVLDQRNSSGLQGFRDAEQACVSQQARLASAEELRHAVVECFFSPCTRGWLHGGKVGTTVCNIVGSTLKAVDVRMENITDVTAHLDAFCIKDKDVPCGDPPSFPNARLQGHSGFELGDELLYTCVPGYVMPSGQSAFSLLCDSCGEWYGLVQNCVRDQTEGHVDYEDKFIDAPGAAERNTESPEEARGQVSEEAHGAVHSDEKMKQEQQETSIHTREGEVHPDEYGDHEVLGEVIDHKRAYQEGEEVEDGSKERAVEDFIGHPRWEQEMTEVTKADTVAATEAPVSLLSQKHMFWFPSEAFQEEGSLVSTNPVTQTTQRASGGQSEESQEHINQERPGHHFPVDNHDDDSDRYDDHDNVDQDDHDNSRQDEQDVQDSHYDDGDESDSRQQEDVRHPARYDELDTRDRHDDADDHDDHYDMGEHEEDNDRAHHNSREYDNGDGTHEQQEIDDHDDVTDDHDEENEDVEVSEEQSEYDDHDIHDDHDDSQGMADLDEEDHSDHDDHHEHIHKEDDRYDDPDSHEIFSIAGDTHQNITQKESDTTDDTWLDGYPVVHEEMDSDSTMEGSKADDRETESVAKTTDRPNEVEIGKSGPYTNSPVEQATPTVPELEQSEAEEVWPGFTGTPAPADVLLEPSDSPSFSDTLDYDTQQAAPTHSWLGDLTEHPFLDHGPAPPVRDTNDVFPGVIEEHTVRNLPGETGDRGDVEGAMEETICIGDDCPPNTPTPSTRGPTVAAIIVAVCALATAVIVGVWCYQRQQRKSSMYEMNGKGQSQSRQAQQIEMQQKV